MNPLLELAKKYNLKIIEDATESLGSEYRGKKTGTLGLLGCLSFNGNKIITTSGGGALLSDDSALIKQARFLATQARDDAPHYQHSQIGYNYRMSKISAGIGRGQMQVLDKWVEKRRMVFERYKQGLSNINAISLLYPVNPLVSSKSISCEFMVCFNHEP